MCASTKRGNQVFGVVEHRPTLGVWIELPLDNFEAVEDEVHRIPALVKGLHDCGTSRLYRLLHLYRAMLSDFIKRLFQVDGSRSYLSYQGLNGSPKLCHSIVNQRAESSMIVIKRCFLEDRSQLGNPTFSLNTPIPYLRPKSDSPTFHANQRGFAIPGQEHEFGQRRHRGHRSIKFFLESMQAHGDLHYAIM